jgi:hypothetical protein
MNIITKRCKFEKYLESILNGRLITDEYLSTISKGVFNYIQDNKLTAYFKNLTLKTVVSNYNTPEEKEIKSYIYDNERKFELDAWNISDLKYKVYD